MLYFPEGFLWGAATSAYQVEGENRNCDWWEWEKRLGLKEASGRACRHYDLYREDFDLAKSLNHNCHRLSIEWSRIEPQEGNFDEKEIRHYQEVTDALLERGIQPVVTLHHFTNPLWFSQRGGWEAKGAGAYFLRYAEKIAQALAEKVRYWVTINEPMVYVYHAYLLGVWPPQKKSFFSARRVENNLARAHTAAYALLHRIYAKKKLPFPQVSIAKNVQAFIPCLPTFVNRFASYLRDRLFNFNFLDRLARQGSLDFIGVNYYTRGLAEVEKLTLRGLLLDTCRSDHRPLKKNSLGWDIYPQGLEELLLRIKKYNLPVIITENGICTPDDRLRWEFIRGHLRHLHRAIERGAPVKGYIYWSLIDNYEWDKGFLPRFGLIEVDYSDFQRKVRPSALRFAQVCKSGLLE